MKKSPKYRKNTDRHEIQKNTGNLTPCGILHSLGSHPGQVFETDVRFSLK